ncbi:MAG: pyridoxamine 5'-phosphate oxidase family protein [Patescibacteria group bacterium]
MEINWNEKIKESLDRTEFMAIATYGDDGSWVCPVQYGYSENLKLYFVSMKGSKHVENILRNGQVALAIFKTERFADGDVLGLQLKGTARHLDNESEIEEAARCYYGRSGEDFKTKVQEHMDENAEWQFFEVTPSELWCFDSRAFGEKRQKADLSAINLPF